MRPSSAAAADRYDHLLRLRRHGVWMLFASLLALGMGQSLFFAILPPIARTIGLTEVQTAIIFSLSAALWVACSPLWGRASDRVGRKPIIMIGIGGFALSTLMFVFVIALALNNMIAPLLILPALMLARAIFGSFGCGAMPASFAYIADRTSRQRRSAGAASVSAAFGIGNVAGPGVAASLVVFGLYAPFLGISILAFLSVIGLALLLPEKIAPQSKARHPRAALDDFMSVLPLILIGLMFSFGQAVIIQLSAFYFMDDLGLAPTNATVRQIGVILTMMALAHIFAQLLIVRASWLSSKFLLRAGAVISAAGFFALAGASSYAGFGIALAFAGFGAGFMRSGMMGAASLIAGPQRQGSVAGMLHSTAAFGHMINPFTGVLLYQINHHAPFFLAGGLMIVCVLLALLHPKIRAVSVELEGEERHISAPIAPAPPKHH